MRLAFCVDLLDSFVDELLILFQVELLVVGHRRLDYLLAAWLILRVVELR